MRFGVPKTKREQALMVPIGQHYGAALQSRFPELLARLDAALAARDTGKAPEPELATPKPNGVLSGIQPLVIVG